MKTPVTSFDGRNIIGHIEDEVFYKPVQASKHQLRKPPGWAIDAMAWEHIRDKVKEIVIQEKESGATYRVTKALFESRRGEFDRGFGRQFFLPLQLWTKSSDGSYQQGLF